MLDALPLAINKYDVSDKETEQIRNVKFKARCQVLSTVWQEYGILFYNNNLARIWYIIL